jgi:RNA polymerase sigma factor (sigma-70 family)
LPPASDGDGALCRQAASGDRSAFAQLVARHEARLRGFLGHVAGPDRGDELAQEAFLKAWQSLGSFRGEAKFSSWLCAIGWRCFIDEVRRDRSEARRREAAALHSEREERPAGDACIDLARALERLDAAERASLVLCEGHGWSHVEAAEILRVPLGTLKGTVARAKRKCREMLVDADG